MNKTLVAAAVLASTSVVLIPTAAHGAATLTAAGPATIVAPQTISVPIDASCDDVGQQTTFIVVEVNQMQGKKRVEGAGDVLDVTCDSATHRYDILVSTADGKWKAGEGTFGSAIISYCFQDTGGTLSCTTQAWIPFESTVTIRKA